MAGKAVVMNIVEIVRALRDVGKSLDSLGESLYVNYSFDLIDHVSATDFGNLCQYVGRLLERFGQAALCELGDARTGKDYGEVEVEIAVAFANASCALVKCWRIYADSLLKWSNPSLLTSLWGRADDEDGEHSWYRYACEELRKASNLDERLLSQVKTANEELGQITAKREERERAVDKGESVDDWYKRALSEENLKAICHSAARIIDKDPCGRIDVEELFEKLFAIHGDLFTSRFVNHPDFLSKFRLTMGRPLAISRIGPSERENVSGVNS